MINLIKKINFFFIIFFFLTNVNSEEKVVYIDMNIIINNSKAGLSINNQMKKLIDDNNKEYENLEKKLIKEKKDLLKKKNVLDPKKFNEEIKNFRVKINDFRKKRQKTIENIKNRNVKTKSELASHVTKILARYSQENNIALVLNKESIVIGKKEIDITEIILDLLNNEIKNIKLKN